MTGFGGRYDVILCPAYAHAGLRHGESVVEENFRGFRHTMAFNVAGWPAAVVRCGTSSAGLPIAVQIAAKAWREDVVLAVAELAVPLWAERAGPTTWHPGHLAERYGLFTLIVLGEVVLAATSTIQEGLTEGEHVGTLLGLAGAGLVIVFSMWWLYFDEPAPRQLASLPVVLTWAYGHYPVFASVAAVGAGLEVAVDFDTGHSRLGPLAAGLATAVPVAVYLVSVWLLRVRDRSGGRLGSLDVLFPLVAVLVLVSPWSHLPIHLTAALLAVLVVASTVIKRRDGRVGS